MVAQIDPAYKSFGLKKVIRRLVSYALFEGRPHTTKGQWFNPVIFLWLRILNLIPGSPTLDKPIFITGLGRSGTTILGKLFSLQKDVGFLNEPKAIWKLIDPRHDINGDYTNSGGVFTLNAQDVSPKARTSAHRLFARYLKSVGATRLVDKYPELIFRVEYLLELFPGCLIIFITRNGVDAIHSIDLWSKRLGIKTSSSTEDWWGRNDIKWNYMREQLLLKDPMYTHISSIISSDLDHLNRAALEWIVTMQTGLKQAKIFPDKIITVKYEEIIQDPEHELERLFSKCSLDHDDNVFDYAKTSLYSPSPKPWPVLIPEIESLFVDMMETLGYKDLYQLR